MGKSYSTFFFWCSLVLSMKRKRRGKNGKWKRALLFEFQLLFYVILSVSVLYSGQGSPPLEWSPTWWIYCVSRQGTWRVMRADTLKSFKCWITKYHRKLWKKMKTTGNCEKSCVPMSILWQNLLTCFLKEG